MSERDLWPAEQRLLECAVTGEVLDLGPAHEAKDPARGMDWPRDRRVRASFLVELLTGRSDLVSGGIRAVRLIGARIDGQLDLNAAIVSCPAIAFVGCVFGGNIDVNSAQLTSLGVIECYVPAIEASGLRCSGTVNFLGTETQQIQLITASIGGQFGINGVRIAPTDGVAIDAWGLTVDRDLWANSLEASGEVRLSGARIGGSLGLNQATLSNAGGVALYAPHLEVARELTAADGFTAVGLVDLSSAKIQGRLDLRDARLDNDLGYALDAAGVTVGQNLAADGLESHGAVSVFGARIGGSLTLGGARLAYPDGVALEATNLSVGKDVWFRNGCRVEGGTNLLDAQIGGVLDITETSFARTRDWAVVADRIRVTGALIGRAVPRGASGDLTKLSVLGGFSLAGARIGGDLDLDDARISGFSRPALIARDVEVDGHVYLREVLTQGRVDLSLSRIARSVWLDGAELRNSRDDALDAGGIVVGDLISCSDGFAADGTVNFTYAQVANEVYLTSASLANPGQLALAGRRIQTGGDVRCSRGFRAVGEVRFMDAQINGRLTFEGADLSGWNATDEPHGSGNAISLQGLNASGLLLETTRPLEGVVDLTDARVGTYSDTKVSWPQRLRLRGFSYRQIEGAGVKDRLDWLSRDDGKYAPGPYDELAAAYRRSGHPDRARLVELTKEKRRRGRLGRVGRAWSWFLYLTVGYGYRTWLAGVWLLVLGAVGSVVFSQLHPDQIQPNAPDAPAWNSLIYTADVVFPLLNLGYQSSWTADGAAAVWVLVLTLAGWLLVTAVVAGLTNSLKRE